MSDQLIVSTAIVRRLNPNCGFVLLDKLEQLDPDTMARFGAWLQEEGLQAIATRVSTNAEECTLIISDGTAAGEDEKRAEVQEALPPAGEWGGAPQNCAKHSHKQQASEALLAGDIGQAATRPESSAVRGDNGQPAPVTMNVAANGARTWKEGEF